jgi:hypothetical protein
MGIPVRRPTKLDGLGVASKDLGAQRVGETETARRGPLEIALPQFRCWFRVHDHSVLGRPHIRTGALVHK